MTTFNNITNDEFRQQACEFLSATQDLSVLTFEQAQNGLKALTLLWMGRTDNWTDQQLQESIFILEIAQKREMKIAFGMKNE